MYGGAHSIHVRDFFVKRESFTILEEKDVFYFTFCLLGIKPSFATTS